MSEEGNLFLLFPKLIVSGEGNLRPLPTDLILEIFSRLPSKSIARCRCLSKLWASLIRSQNFTELFLTQSATRPRILFNFGRKDGAQRCFYSCPQPQISDKNPESSLSVTAEFHMSILNDNTEADDMTPSISGLTYAVVSQVLFNPSTRQSLQLPLLPESRLRYSYLGYDPIDKQFSVLAISESPSDRDLSCYQILKLGSGNLSWRSLDCPLSDFPALANVCIDGTSYFYFSSDEKIACLDLNTEEFKFIDQPLDLPKTFVDFKGKLGVICTRWQDLRDNKPEFELSLWVLEDVTKQEWSKHVYFLPSRLCNTTRQQSYHILGLTGKGDIVLTLPYTTYPFYAFFFNLEKKSLHKVEIKGLEEVLKGYDVKGHYFDGYVDYVEDLRFPELVLS